TIRVRRACRSSPSSPVASGSNAGLCTTCGVYEGTRAVWGRGTGADSIEGVGEVGGAGGASGGGAGVATGGGGAKEGGGAMAGGGGATYTGGAIGAGRGAAGGAAGGAIGGGGAGAGSRSRPAPSTPWTREPSLTARTCPGD